MPRLEYQSYAERCRWDKDLTAEGGFTDMSFICPNSVAKTYGGILTKLFCRPGGEICNGLTCEESPVKARERN